MVTSYYGATRAKSMNPERCWTLLALKRKPLFPKEQGGPVLDQGQGADVFVGGNIEEEALAIGRDVVLDHALSVRARSGPEGEKRDGVADFDATSFLRDGSGTEFAPQAEEVQFLAVTAPTR